MGDEHTRSEEKKIVSETSGQYTNTEEEQQNAEEQLRSSLQK
jgi:hypothetical protein